MSRVYAASRPLEGCRCSVNGVWYPTPWVQLVVRDGERTEPIVHLHRCLACAREHPPALTEPRAR